MTYDPGIKSKAHAHMAGFSGDSTRWSGFHQETNKIRNE